MVIKYEWLKLTVFSENKKTQQNAEFYIKKSGWQDSNLRPPRPKRGAITGLRYTPKILIIIFRTANIEFFFIIQ